MNLDEKAQQAINEEQDILQQVLAALENQKKEKAERLKIESARARELTSNLVATRRVEDKAMMASDEAVAHGLKDKQKSDLAVIDRLVSQPYFARMVLEEEEGTGRTRLLEYKIGLAENSECRIIDWRKAALARLYYEYREGEEYCEEIQGRERSGRIALRNMVDIERSVLKRLSCRLGTFVLQSGQWQALSQGLHPSESALAAGTEPVSKQHLLPQIANLLDAQQFNLISENPDRAVLIQGVAGSGKTTVALHRLAWLLANEEQSLKAEQCLVLVLSPSLKTYISRTLPALGVEGVRILTFGEWTGELLARIAPHLIKSPAEEGERAVIRRSPDNTPASIDRLKRSMAMLRAVEAYVARLKSSEPQRLETLKGEEVLLALLKTPQAIIEHDETKLIDKELIRAALSRATSNFAAQAVDLCDVPLIVRVHQLIKNSVYLRDGQSGRYEHIFADEVQDYSPPDLACIVGAVSKIEHLTLCGDTSQKIDPGASFPGWDKLRRYWSFKESLARFIKLDISYRSTAEILRLADYIQQTTSAERVTARHGRVPIWFKCHSETRGIKAAQDWLLRAVEKYPGVLSAVICRDAAQAKHVLSLLKPSFGPAVRPGDEASFSFEGGVVVTHLHQARGLEFTNLLVWNPSHKDYPQTPDGRNALYLVVSRARENLCIVTWGRQSPLLPGINSPIVRGYDIASEELAEMEGEQDGAR